MSDNHAINDLSPDEALRFYLDVGVDETTGSTPLDRYALSKASAKAAKLPPPAVAVSPPKASAVAQRPGAASSATSHGAPQSAIGQSAAITAAAAMSLKELKAAVEAFDGCALKSTAKSTVFADGNPDGRLMVIGEAPGSDEDRQGLPFIGVAGKLLDRMLGSIGYSRETAYIINVIPWRPPGNRNPTPEEVAICTPFLERHVALVKPEVILMVGGLSAKTLLNRPEGITRLRGRWEAVSALGLEQPIPAIATFHPTYLLRSPQQKRLAWRDLLAVKEKLDSLAGA